MSSTTPHHHHQQQQQQIQLPATAPGAARPQGPAFTFGNYSTVSSSQKNNFITAPAPSSALNMSVVNGNLQAQPSPAAGAQGQPTLVMNANATNFNFKPMIHPDMQAQGQIPIQFQQQQQQQPLVSSSNGPMNLNFNPSTATISTNYNDANTSGLGGAHSNVNVLPSPLQFTPQAPVAAAPVPGTKTTPTIGLSQFIENQKQLQQSSMMINSGKMPVYPLNVPLNAPASMNASLINVTTASYSDPKPSTSKQTIKIRPASATKISTQAQAVRLAVVPTQLASKSIVSLNPAVLAQKPQVDNGSSSSNASVISTPTLPSIQTQHVQQHHSLIPTTAQVQQRQRSSYSSACDATIRAQCALTTGTDGSSIKPLNGSVAEAGAVKSPVRTSASVATTTPVCGTRDKSPGKRSSPTSDPEDSKSKHKYVKVFGGKPSLPQTIHSNSNLTLQQYLCNMLKSRGYSDQHYCSLEGGYYCKPTDLQKASYGMKLIQAVRTSDTTLLRKLLRAGLSPNPCNAFGESIIHMVCRRGDVALLKIFLEAGCSVQVSDDFGRTPLHDACWTASPCFESVELILNQDRRLLHIVDCRGSAPLSYVKRVNWPQWIDFFEQRKEVWWPQRDISEDGEEGPPKLVNMAPHSLPLPNPNSAASLKDASKISSGEVDVDSIPTKDATSLSSSSSVTPNEIGSPPSRADATSSAMADATSPTNLKGATASSSTISKIENRITNTGIAKGIVNNPTSTAATSTPSNSSPVSISISTEQ